MTKRLFSVLLAVIIALAAIPAFAAGGNITKNEYTDISGHWANTEINSIAGQNVFGGSDGRFNPDSAVKRSEFVTLLHKALGIQIAYFKATDIKEFFSDVSNEDPYASALYDLVIANIIDSREKFKPDEALSREDMVHYVINSLEYMTGGNYAMIKIFPMPFADDSQIDPSYKNDFVKAQVLKLIYGRGAGKFYPRESATRAEAATIIYRLVNLLKNLKADQIQVIPSVQINEDSMIMKLVLSNNTGNPVVISHTSGQKYDFALFDSDKKEIYRWSADKIFIQAATETVLEPGKSVEFVDTVQGKTYSDLKDKAVYLKGYVTGESSSFTINQDGYEIRIK